MRKSSLSVLTFLLTSSFTQSFASDRWEQEPATRWTRDFSSAARDGAIPLPATSLASEGIGSKASVHGLFDRWALSYSVTGGRGTHFAEVTRQCKGLVELEFALTPEEWGRPERRRAYYASVDALIGKVAHQLLADFGDPITGPERESFVRALRALAWQESRWQHGLRYKDWFFVFLSGGSYNVLDDWGISQVARSGFNASQKLNESFFASRGHCSIGSSLYYGFMEYFFSYLEARKLPCNQAGVTQKILGAYNQYSSGFSYCHDGLSGQASFRDYQRRAMGGLSGHFRDRPWEQELAR